jgi:hypothetical protein
MTVQVTFRYEPDEPDENDPTGVSSEEFDRTSDRLMMEFGAEDVQFSKVTETREPVQRRRKDA